MNKEMLSRYSKRNSSIELIKVIAIIMIVISHSMSDGRTQHGAIDIFSVTWDWQLLSASLLKHIGQIGNCIFIVCSSWFLLESKKVNTKKIVMLIGDCFTISVVWLVVFLASGYELETKFILKQFFPVTFGNCWFVTCYILFYAIHPLLNTVIKSINKEIHLCLCLGYIVLYCVIGFIMNNDLFYYTDLLGFIGIYFMVAYVRNYLTVFTSSKRNNFMVLAIGIIGWLGSSLITNILGFHLSFLQDQMQRWCNIANPFFLLIAISALNIARQKVFHNKFINYLSSLSLLIYMIHTNRIIRDYFRYDIFEYIKIHYSFDNLICWILLFTAVNLIGSVLIAVIYRGTLRKLVNILCDKLNSKLKQIYKAIIPLILKVD